MDYMTCKNLVSQFVAVKANTINDDEKRELRRAIDAVERRNSRTLSEGWHTVRINCGCVSYGTIFADPRWTRQEVRRMVKGLFYNNDLAVIHTAIVKAGIAVRVDVYTPHKKGGSRA